jgi:hypothetical protein
VPWANLQISYKSLKVNRSVKALLPTGLSTSGALRPRQCSSQLHLESGRADGSQIKRAPLQRADARPDSQWCPPQDSSLFGLKGVQKTLRLQLVRSQAIVVISSDSTRVQRRESAISRGIRLGSKRTFADVR